MGQQVALVILEQNGGPWLLSSVYTSTDYKEWRGLWAKIFRLMLQGLPSLIVSDFNCIVSPHEKRGGRQAGDGIESKEFRDFISEASLIDLGYVGPHFTWCNNCHGIALSLGKN